MLDGKVSCGKSITLAMLVHWARDEGWLVFYVPEALTWTQNGCYYKNTETGLWDTPGHAESILRVRIHVFSTKWFLVPFESLCLEYVIYASMLRRFLPFFFSSLFLRYYDL